MKIAYDARALNVAFLRGIGRCMKEIITRCNKKYEFERCHLFSNRPDMPMQIEKAGNIKTNLLDMPGYRFKIWEQFVLPWKAYQSNSQILHCPANNVPWWQPLKTVVTLHDAMPWLGDEEAWPRGFYTDRLIPSAFRKADAVITISENSRQDILSFWPDLESRLTVIYNGVSDDFIFYKPAPLADFFNTCGLKKPYLLYMGGPIRRKRLYFALQIFEQLEGKKLQLAVCGSKKHEVEKLFHDNCPTRHNDVITLPFIPDELMPNLYQNAAAVLYPTLYEGFGLPALEAQAIGTPVLFSRVASLKELEGPGAFIMPVDDQSAWVDLLNRLVLQRKENPDPDLSSRSWTKKFSWDVCAQRHIELYQSVISEY